MKETELNGYVFDFSADYEIIDADDILVIYTYLMKKNNTKQCFDLLKNIYWIIKRWHIRKFPWIINF